MRQRISRILQTLPAPGATLLALLALALLLISKQTLEAARGQGDTTRASLAKAMAEVAKVEELMHQDQLIRTQLAAFHDRGLDRPIDELRWHEALGTARQDLHLFALSYDLAPERPARAPSGLPSPSLRVETLHLEAVLRHEEDFLALLHRLDRVGEGVRTRSCRLARAPADDLPARLTARCELERASIRVQKGGSGQGEAGNDAPPPTGEASTRKNQDR